MTQVYIRQPVMRLNDGTQTRHNDTLATEEPLKLRVADPPVGHHDAHTDPSRMLRLARIHLARTRSTKPSERTHLPRVARLC